jgi:hypothetical protein
MAIAVKNNNLPPPPQNRVVFNPALFLTSLLYPILFYNSLFGRPAENAAWVRFVAFFFKAGIRPI